MNEERVSRSTHPLNCGFSCVKIVYLAPES